ncbi:MAG TPA: cell division protein FtsL [Lachnospiraceae bacterium]|nr:septum formation initiator family protein [uncultured Lachnoclostridium sp.]HAU84276.1 cell division protein FtsL [Lachnospiraceae bacterium]
MKTNGYANNKYVIEGNNARKLQGHASQPSYEESMNEWLERRERNQRQRRSDEARKRRLQREQETRMDLATFIFLTGAVICTFYVCISYINVRSQVTNTSKKIASVESEIISIKNTNQIALEKVDDSVDLAYVYRVATKELGMVHPKSNQVIKYQQVKSDYLKQYADIPEVKDESVLKKIVKKLKKN